MSILRMATDLVRAQIQQDNIDGDSIGFWLAQTHRNLLELWQTEIAPPAEPEPSDPVNWRRSIRQTHVICLECGQRFRQLGGKHLSEHGLNASAYRLKHRIPPDFPLSFRQTTRRRREVMQAIRPWAKRGVGRPRKGEAK